MKLEECILKGEVRFMDIQWITISSQGTCKIIHVYTLYVHICIPTAKVLIEGMLCKDTTRRLTALRVLNDPWFTVSMYTMYMYVGY